MEAHRWRSSTTVGFAAVLRARLVGACLVRRAGSLPSPSSSQDPALSSPSSPASPLSAESASELWFSSSVARGGALAVRLVATFRRDRAGSLLSSAALSLHPLSLSEPLLLSAISRSLFLRGGACLRPGAGSALSLVGCSLGFAFSSLAAAGGATVLATRRLLTRKAWLDVGAGRMLVPSVEAS